MFEARRTARFATWLAGLRDERARARILKRLDRARGGTLGGVGAVGGGVSFVLRNSALIVLLCGGDKSVQDADIGEERALAEGIE